MRKTFTGYIFHRHAVAQVSILLALGLTVSVYWESQREIRADWASAAARRNIVEWASGSSTPKTDEDWNSALQAIKSSLLATPDDADLHERVGDLYMVAGQRDWDNVLLRRSDFTQAAANYCRAIEIRPQDPQAWAALATSFQAMGADSARVNIAWTNARRLGPYESVVRPMLILVAVSQWEEANPEMRDWINSLLKSGTPYERRTINELGKEYGLQVRDDSTLGKS